MLKDFTLLSPDTLIRLQYLDNIKTDVNLPAEEYIFWHNILSNRILYYEELEAFIKDYHDTPVEVSKLIQDIIRSGQITVSLLISSKGDSKRQNR